MKHSRKTDSNQMEIIRMLRRFGCTVVDLSDVGRGVPDLLVGRALRTYLLEVKSVDGKCTPDQIRWRNRWIGRPVAIVRTVEEALAAVGVEFAVANRLFKSNLQEVTDAR